MSDLTLDSLLGFPNSDGVKDVLLSFVQRATFPLTDFSVGSNLRNLIEIETAVTDDLIAAISNQIAGGDLDGSSGDWLTTLAHGWYAVERAQATVGKQSIVLACATGYGPHAIVAGVHVFAGSDGARYFAATGGTVTGGGTLSIDVIAESPGAMRGLVNSLVSKLPGVSVSSASVYLLGGTTPVYGTDAESDASVDLRCDARWPSLDVTTSEDRVVKWAKAASTEVTRTRLDPDTSNAGGVLLTLAGAGGPVTSPAVTAVQTYIDARLPITDYVTAQNSTSRVITGGGTVFVPTAQAAQIKAAAEIAWNTFLSQTQIGMRVYVSQMVKIVMDLGAYDFINAELNGSNPWVDLTATQVPVPDGAGLTGTLTWSPV